MSQAALAALLPLAVASPLVAAAICPLVSRISGRLPLVISVLALGASSLVLLLAAPSVYGGKELVHYMGHWVPVGGAALGIAFAADPWGLTFALIASLVGAVVLIFTLSEQSDLGRRELGGFTCLFLLLEAALIGVGLTADLFNLFVWFEVAALASYALTAFFLERPLALEAAFKILVLTNIASFTVFIGASLVYAKHGALNFGQIHAALAGNVHTIDLIALALLLGGFATKSGLVPFHGWLPDAHTAAPGPVSALFSGLMVSLGIVVVGRLTFQIFTPDSARPILGLLMGLGTLSAIGGAVFAVFQDDLKRLLAYDTISQMGLLTVGLATATPSALAGTTYQLVNHALFKTLLFLVAGAIVHATGATKLSEMGGLARRSPWLAAAFVVGVMSIAGLPPLNGYASVGLIHDGLRSTGQWFPYVMMLVAQALTVAALGKAAWMAFFRPQQSQFDRDERMRPGMLGSLAILGGACVALGVLPSVLLRHVLEPAVGGLLGGAQYAQGILSVGGHLSMIKVHFAYFSPEELVTTAVVALAAIPIGLWASRNAEHRLIRRFRGLQSGSVNDYASYLVAGMVVVVAALTLF